MREILGPKIVENIGFFQISDEKSPKVTLLEQIMEASMEDFKDSQITIEMSQKGFCLIRVGADDAKDLSRAHLLLAKVAPELRALDEALRRPAKGASVA